MIHEVQVLCNGISEYINISIHILSCSHLTLILILQVITTMKVFIITSIAVSILSGAANAFPSSFTDFFSGQDTTYNKSASIEKRHAGTCVPLSVDDARKSEIVGDI
jgi:hypothetical protein